MRLIDADALRKEIRELPNEATDCSYLDLVDREVVQALISEAPTVDRPHGEWIDESKDALKCSACGKWVYKPFIGGFPTERTQHYNPNYCAFCGADMRKEGEAE